MSQCAAIQQNRHHSSLDMSWARSSARRRVVTDELLELVDLSEKREAYVQTLSRGMRQRLYLAHALFHRLMVETVLPETYK